MNSLDHALAYAVLGWRVAPVPPGFKHPHGVDDWHKKATIEADKIRYHWGKHPDHGVCIATGPGSGIVAIDIDTYAGGDDGWAELEALHGPAPDTVEAVTGGGGRHLLFRYPVNKIITNSADHLPLGVDVRGEGGQIVVAPTVHPKSGRQYAWEVEHDPLDGYPVADMPPWLLELLTRPPVAQEARRERSEYTGSDSIVDRYNAAHTWPELLEPDGWTFHSRRCVHTTGETYELWTRPGKTVREGASASLYYMGSDVLKVFTSSASPLAATRTYTKYGYEAEMRHGGDQAAMGRAARAQLGASTIDGPSEPTRMTEQLSAPSAPVSGPRPVSKPAIVHNGRQLDDLAREGVRALASANMPPQMFVRSGTLVRLREDESQRPLIESLRADHVRATLADAADWYRTTKDGVRTATSPPLDLATTVLVAGRWPFPALAGVVELPVLRPDGSFHADHGYDKATRLYHWHRGDPYEPIAAHPGPADLAAAVALVDELLHDFPWDTTADRANAWALLLTPLVRAIIGQVPMALIDAPEPGTGKGLLVKACSIVTTGHAAALMAWPTSDEELEKKVSATLMAGNTVVVFDNVEGMIRSPTLAAVLTADTWQGRILGRSEMTTVPNRATWAATGNNIDVGGDLARRCYRIRLDARQAQPWLRTGFQHDDLEGWATANRSRLLHALCTIVRSWWGAGKPQADALPAMGGYSTWVRIVGGILEHAGVGDFLANLAEFHASADRDAAEWEAFLSVWSEKFGEQQLTVSELFTHMNDQYFGHQLREVLPGDLGGEFGKAPFTRMLGHALRKHAGRHHGPDGLHLVEMPKDRRRVSIYSVTNRSMTLDLDSGARDVALTSRAVQVSDQGLNGDRGICGIYTTARGLKNLSTGQPEINGKSQGPAAPRHPAHPAVQDNGAGQPQEMGRGMSESHPAAPADDDDGLF